MPENNGYVEGNANNDIKKPKQEYVRGTQGTTVKGKQKKHPYLKIN